MTSIYLDPKTTLFDTAPDGTMRVMVPNDRCSLQVQAWRAFPLSHSEEQIVLRDGANKEVGILRDLTGLPEPARDMVRAQLHRRYFLPRILKIYSIFERFGTTQWEFETDRGRREVTTKPIHEALFEMSPGRYLITDNENNRYEIHNLSALDETSRALFLGKG